MRRLAGTLRTVVDRICLQLQEGSGRLTAIHSSNIYLTMYVIMYAIMYAIMRKYCCILLQ